MMPSIIARNVSVVFPLLGSDKRFVKPKEGGNAPVGGRIRRGRDAGIVAIEDFSIELSDGDRLGIFGHNGSGKSTLLRVLGGIYPPTSGSIEIIGTAAGMFSLSLGVNREATGLQNIQFKGLMRGMSRREVDELVPKIAEFSELGDYLHLPVKTYSSGMVMRLMFATASMLNPDILLLDEWVSAGDKSFQDKADKYLDDILQSVKIVIVASQNEARLRSWSNKLVYLKQGQSVPVPDAPLPPFKPNPDAVLEYQRLVNARAFKEALALVQGIWPVDRAPFEHYLRAGNMLDRLNEEREALAAYEQALTVNPESAAIHNLKGKLLYRLGEAERAVEHIRTALKLSNGTVGDMVILQRVGETTGHDADASEKQVVSR